MLLLNQGTSYPMSFCVLSNILCPSVHFYVIHMSRIASGWFSFQLKQTPAHCSDLFIYQRREERYSYNRMLINGNGAEVQNTACSDTEAQILKGSLKDYCRDKD